MAADLVIQGFSDVQAKLKGLVTQLPQACMAALYAEMQIERTESMKRTPVDTGALRASHVVRIPEVTGNLISCVIAVGGPAAPYAIPVHENEEAFHKVGQSKFLESTILESAPYMSDRVARRIAFESLIK